MPKITKFDREICESLAVECVAELQAVAAKYGLSVSRAGGKFSDAEYTTHLKFAITDVDARETAERKVWNTNCDVFGLEPRDYGTEFTSQGKTYKAVGFTNSGKFPVAARNVATGQAMRFSEMVITVIKANRKA